jgi:hypothetical protein
MPRARRIGEIHSQLYTQKRSLSGHHIKMHCAFHLIALHPHLLSASLSRLCHFAEPLLASKALNKLSMVPAARDNRVPLPLSIVGSFSPLPWLEYAGDSVVPDMCHALGAVRMPLVAMRGDATSVIVGSPPFQVNKELWSLLGRSPATTCQRSHAMTDREIHPFNKSGVESSRDA